jgi:Iap family predicted aminopeptidase
MFKDSRLTVVERPKQIDEADSWEELYAAIDAAGKVVSSGKEYSATVLKSALDKVRRREGKITLISRGENLRAMAVMLLIKEAKNFDDLYATLDFVVKIQGSGCEYSSKQLIDAIEVVRSAKDKMSRENFRQLELSSPIFQHITRACGLRAKVVELLNSEK